MNLTNVFGKVGAFVTRTGASVKSAATKVAGVVRDGIIRPLKSKVSATMMKNAVKGEAKANLKLMKQYNHAFVGEALKKGLKNVNRSAIAGDVFNATNYKRAVKSQIFKSNLKSLLVNKVTIGAATGAAIGTTVNAIARKRKKRKSGGN